VSPITKKSLIYHLLLFLVVARPAGLFSQEANPTPLDEAIRTFEAFVHEHMALDQVPGLSVGFMKDGHVWVRGFGYSDLENEIPARADNSYRLASISKTITALAVLQLAEQGKIDLDKEVQAYVPYFPKKKWPVTVRHLLGHIGGISHYRDFNVEGHIKVPKSTKESLAIFQDFDLLARPGTRYVYSSYGYNLLGAVIEGASGQPYEVYITENILKPLGMSNTRLDSPVDIIPHRVRGYRLIRGQLANSEYVDISSRFAAGGIRSTIVDLLRYSLGIIQKKLLKEETWRQMFTSMVLQNGHFTHYGMGWDVHPLNGHFQIAHGGSQAETRTYLMIFPTERFALAMASNLESFDRPFYVNRLAELVLGEDLDLAIYAADKVNQSILNACQQIFSYGISMYDWHKGHIAKDEKDLTRAFTFFHKNVNHSSLRAGLKKTRIDIGEGFHPSRGQALIKVGSYMAHAIAEEYGLEKLKSYRQKGPLAFFKDYIALSTTWPKSLARLKLGKSISSLITTWAKDWDTVYTDELRMFFVSPSTDFVQLESTLKEMFAGAGIYPDYTKQIARVSLYFSKKEQHAEAFNILDMAVNLYPNRAGPLSSLAAAHVWAKNFDSALALYKRALSLNPDHSGVALNSFYHLARQLNDAGKNDRIMVAFAVAEALYPKNAKLLTDIGDLYLVNGHKDKAIEYYKRAVDISPHFKLAKEKLESAKHR
jgi:CubicO group peptidase (beta-lactamase class C family)/predicted negative regulator of RcsB-dependent stress response